MDQSKLRRLSHRFNEACLKLRHDLRPMWGDEGAELILRPFYQLNDELSHEVYPKDLGDIQSTIGNSRGRIYQLIEQVISEEEKLPCQPSLFEKLLDAQDGLMRGIIHFNSRMSRSEQIFVRHLKAAAALVSLIHAQASA